MANPVLPNGPTGAVRDDLVDYIANQPAAIQLGKALFWDMQAGSDSKLGVPPGGTACATCHFQAGADVRTRNQLNQGTDKSWDAYVDLAPNYSFNDKGNDFPFTAVPLNRDTDNIAGSQGVRKSTFVGIGKKGAELTTPVSDPVFNVGGVNVRQVTGKNTPSMINAVFNHRNFWNGRAQPDFNGVNPFGSRDSSARVWIVGLNGTAAQIDIHIQNASPASQAVGPPLNPVEMSAAGRTFPDLGHKLLLVKALGLQRVDPTDSVLGSLADTTAGKGLKVTYASLIQKAFQPKWWNYKKKISLNGKSYTMTEANFSLFWGLSIMLYEATLVADSSPMDRYLATRVFSPNTFDPAGVPLLVSHDPTLLDPAVSRLAAEGISVTRDDILNGLALFERPVAPPPSFPVPAGFGAGCIGCHTGAETTSASVRNLTGPGVEIGDVAFKKAGFDLRMERMFMKADWTPPGPLSPVPAGADTITFDPSTYEVNVTNILIPPGDPSLLLPLQLPVATYDAGWYNLGVRLTAEDLGLGATDDVFGTWSWTRLFQATVPGLIAVPGNGLGCLDAGNATFPNTLLNATGFPLLSGPLHDNEATDVDGTFKVPGLVYLVNVLEMPDGRKPNFNPPGATLFYKVPLMKIVIGGAPPEPDQSNLPSNLRPMPVLPKNKTGLPQRQFILSRGGGVGGETQWLINGLEFDPLNPLALPQRSGAGEVWNVVNGGGGWVHPMHMHMEEHTVLSRVGSTNPHPDDTGKEDVVALDPSESVFFFRRFRTFLGNYVAHCHNLAHEDHNMMFGWSIVS